MDLALQVDAHDSIPICWSGAEPCTDLMERAGLPRVPALPRELGSVGITPNAVARAIEDLQRSGYRPLHTPGSAEVLVDPASARRPRRDA